MQDAFQTLLIPCLDCIHVSTARILLSTYPAKSIHRFQKSMLHPLLEHLPTFKPPMHMQNKCKCHIQDMKSTQTSFYVKYHNLQNKTDLQNF